MSKKYIFLSLTLALAAANTTLATAGNLPIHTVSAKLKAANKPIEVKNFNSVAAGGPIKVIITLGAKEGVRFEGDEDAIASLVAEVKGSALIIRPQVSWKSWAHKYKGKQIIAHVNAKTINSLTMSGDGAIVVTGTITQNALTTTLSGSGSITAAIAVDSYNGVISGSGALNIRGEANDAKVAISGSGSVAKNTSLKVQKLTSTISGSGSIYVSTNGEISAVISGSGSVYYSGNADITEKVLMGSGGVKKIN